MFICFPKPSTRETVGRADKKVENLDFKSILHFSWLMPIKYDREQPLHKWIEWIDT